MGVHITLKHYVAQHPHSRAMRKRIARKLAPIRLSRANELWYKKALLALTGRLRQVTRDILLPVVKQYAPQEVTTDAIPQAPQDAISAAFELMQKQFGGIDNLALRLAQTAIEKNNTAVDQRLISSVKLGVGVDISTALTAGPEITGAMASALTANVELIKSIPQQYFEKLEALVYENFKEGLRFEALADNISHIADVTDSRAKLIARDQTSKMNGEFNKVRQTGLGIAKYQWATAGDERVREDHADNDGQIFSWDDPPPTGHPGHDINCRCVAVPFFDLDEQPEPEQ